MLHPNHKLQTRLQLIKRLLNTPNCEIILKCILSQSDGNNNQNSPLLTFNLKFSYYLNALTLVNNNDKEILIHLINTLINVGFNYKAELNQNIYFDLSDTPEGSYLYVQNATATSTNNSSKIAHQLEKEFDEQIIKIYTKTNMMFKKFLNSQFDKLTEDLNEFSTSLTNQVVSMHSAVRKLYLQRLKNKRIQCFDVKQKWISLIENMTHEKCLFFDPNSACNFYVLDQTEGPNRERRRLKRSHLFIPERFFKKEHRHKLLNEKQQTSLAYLLSNYEDYLTNNGASNGSRMGDYFLYHLKNSQVIKYPCACKNVMPYCEIKGELLLSESRINFAADEKNNNNGMIGSENLSSSWSYDDIKEIHLRRYLLKDVGLELFLVYGQTILLAFEDKRERDSIHKSIINHRKIKNLIKSNESIDEITNLWRESKISNYEYIMQLNKYSGRTFNDLMQYPIYPHILANYSSETLDLSLRENFRDLAKPVAIQHQKREEKFLQNYKMLYESSDEAYHYASLYSNSGTVLHYLVRLPPFTKMFLDYQDQNFDVPDRTFHSMNTSWLLSSSDSTTDYKELIPEFFFLHEFLTNRQEFNFGVRQNGEGIDNVVLPLWCQSNPRLFIIIMRQALESNYVTNNLNNWIDLIFGYKQSGKAALDAINCYHPACYFGYPVEQISDPVQRKAIETMIKTWGQTPKQLFTSNTPHPQVIQTQTFKRAASSTDQINTLTNSSNLNNFNFPKTSIHRLVFNLKWGNYVGSLEQVLPPVCVWKENCKKNIVSLISLPSNDVIGLAQKKCLLLERANNTSLKTLSNADTLNMSIIEWGSFDDYIKIKVENDKPATNLLPIRSNEHSIVCCSCVGSNYLVMGERSGLLSVFKLRKEKNNQIQYDSFNCYLYGHKSEITDICVCLNFSTMITSSQDGLLMIWDTNKLSYVNSIEVKNQNIYKISISETTNDIAFIGNTPNRLYFYTGNCDFIGTKNPNEEQNESEELNENVNMKSLCFSNGTEGQNVNVIATGMSNGRIRLFSTWDLTLLREIVINYDSNTVVGCIIALTFTKDCKRLYVSDTYARVYILESAYSPAANSKIQQQQLLSSIPNLSNAASLVSNSPNGFFSNIIYYA